MQVKLEHIIEGMEMQSEENRSYLNLKTGEIVYVSQEALAIADDGEDYEHLPEWQQEDVKLAYDIVDSFDQFAGLPSSFDIDEYEMMESYCNSLSDSKTQDALLASIRGKGAFQRFKDSVNRLGISDQWYDYRDMKYEEIAIEFCKSKNIDYIKKEY
ncbi:hypothetical protein BABA_13427 [Neobacillus bataviensis LMG 21833]|uniref:Uncharacterized protein n=1 Tax=Neobacillus bataviensis LMG 21833 TaxID=1117379 RepID=K6D317_9BACI|nr:UPF0158 family protein [Neobacillus bataviensis]EKN66892.1 hypothetical protein BABA_13427 [Neobacillus bataviensis LMG 21833]